MKMSLMSILRGAVESMDGKAFTGTGPERGSTPRPSTITYEGLVAFFQREPIKVARRSFTVEELKALDAYDRDLRNTNNPVTMALNDIAGSAADRYAGSSPSRTVEGWKGLYEQKWVMPPNTEFVDIDVEFAAPIIPDVWSEKLLDSHMTDSDYGCSECGCSGDC